MGDSTLPLSAFAVSALLCWLLAPLAMRWTARRAESDDRRTGRASLLVLLAGAAITALRWIPPDKLALSSLLGLGGGIGLVTAVGGAIDRDTRRGRLRCLQAAAAGAVILAFFGVRLGLLLRLPPAIQALPTIVWVTSITAAFCFARGGRVLPAGLGAATGLGLALANVPTAELGVAVLAASIGGACLGLVPQLRAGGLDLGAAGSAAIGFSLAAISVLGVYVKWAPVAGLAIFTPAAICAVPLLDLGLASLLRWRAGEGLLAADRRGFGSRLRRRGYDESTASALLCLHASICAVAGAWLPVGTAIQDLMAIAVSLASLAILLLIAGVAPQR